MKATSAASHTGFGLDEDRTITFDPLGFGVDMEKPSLRSSLSPERYQGTTQNIQAPLTGLCIVAADRTGSVGARRDIRGRPMRWDREDELDLADLGGETARRHRSC